MNLIEKYQHGEAGYNPVLVSEGWQAAIANYSEELDVKSLKKIDIHFKTDEAFVLIEGECVLTSGEIEGGKMKFASEKLRQGTIYNIPKKVWHNIAMRPKSSVVIIEKDLTHESDYDFYHFSDAEYIEFWAAVNSAFEKAL